MERDKYVLLSGTLLFLCFISSTMVKATKPQGHSTKDAPGLAADSFSSRSPDQHYSTRNPKAKNLDGYPSRQNPTKVTKLTDDVADGDNEWGGFSRTQYIIVQPTVLDQSPSADSASISGYKEGLLYQHSQTTLVNNFQGFWASRTSTETNDVAMVRGTQSNSYLTDQEGTQSYRSDSQTTKPRKKNPFRLYCGKLVDQYSPMVSHRILNGKEAKPHSWPWQVFVQNKKNGNLCGGCIIPVVFNERESDVVLTAAHCIGKNDNGDRKNRDKNSNRNVTVVAGLHNIKFQNGPSVQRRTSSIAVVQYAYSDKAGLGKYDKDIALLFLEEPFQFTDTVQPVCLPKEEEKVPVGQTCVVTGWGTNHTCTNKRRPQEKLQQLFLTVQPEKDCEERFPDIWVDYNMICASNQNGQTCQGDSGGPVQCQGKDGRWTVQGVVSYGGTCGNVEDPGIYSNVARYRDWIMKMITRHSKTWQNNWINDNKIGNNTDHNSNKSTSIDHINKNGSDIEDSTQNLGPEILKNSSLAPVHTYKNQTNGCTPTNCTNSPDYGRALCEWLVKHNRSRCTTDGCFAHVHCCESCAKASGVKWPYPRDNPIIMSMPPCEDSSECEEEKEDSQHYLTHSSNSGNLLVPCQINGTNKMCLEWSCRNDLLDSTCNSELELITRCITDSIFARFECCRSCALELGAQSLDPRDPVILSMPL